MFPFNQDFTFYLHLFSYVLCFFMPLLSSLAHLFHCVNEHWYMSCWDADHIGILALWLARALCEGYVILYCHRPSWMLWAVLCFVVFGWSGWEMMRSHSSALFLPLFAFIHLPLLFMASFEDSLWFKDTSVMKYAFQPEMLPNEDLGELLREGVTLTLVGSACGVIGYAVMVAKVPERFFAHSGRFDLWLHSHQWWHVLTIVGPILCLEGGRVILHARLTFSCSA
jgi:predicted membrane channel-forming protein YqfA (hemolysin III family)